MITTLHPLIRELEARSTIITNMGLTSSLSNSAINGSPLFNLANTNADLDRVARAIEALVTSAGMIVTDAEVTIRQLLNDRHFYGSYCELGAYDWLARHHARFTAQVKLTSHDVLNPNGCTIDGKFEGRDAFFDIKGMGFQAYVADRFKVALSKQLNGLTVTLDGPMDISVKDIETFAFGNLQTLIQKLANGGVEQIRELGWTVRAAPPQRVTTSINTIDPYRLAKENRYYPFKTAGQFTRNDPFVLIFPYAAQFNHSLSQNFVGSSDIALRSMARRAFIQLTKDSSPADAFDKQVGPGITVGAAAKLLAGLMFVNLENDEGWMFLNPYATHVLTQSHVNQIFDFSAPIYLGIDDFADDNY